MATSVDGMQMTHNVMSDTVRFTIYKFRAVCICALLATTKLTSKFVTRPATINKAYTIISATSAWPPKSRSSRCLSLNNIRNASSRLKLNSGNCCSDELKCGFDSGVSDWSRSSIRSNLWISARVDASFRSSHEEVRVAWLIAVRDHLPCSELYTFFFIILSSYWSLNCMLRKGLTQNVSWICYKLLHFV